MGAAYVFTYNAVTDLWDQSQRLTSSAWTRSPREFFGNQVVFGDGWLAVGAPGYRNGSGAVYTYWLDPIGYIAAQLIVSPYPELGAHFGCSLAAEGLQLVIGACQATDEVVYLER